MKRVYIIHGWDGDPNGSWIPWLKSEIQKLGIEAIALKMPNPERPDIKTWINFFEDNIEKLDKNTYFVGHSVGCQTILRYLQKKKNYIGGAVFVAGWFSLTGLSNAEEEKIASPWQQNNIDLNSVKKYLGKSAAIFSDNDPFVPLESNIEKYKILGSKILIENRLGHIWSEEIKKVTPILQEFKLIANV